MKAVYQAENGLDAKLVSDLLTQFDIENEIRGQYLQGGIGELPAGGFVHVFVAEKDFDEARKLIDEWEHRPIPPDSEEQQKEASPKTGSWGSFFFGFAAGLLCGVFALYTYQTKDGARTVTTEGVDYTGDGNLDEKWFYSRSGWLQRIEIDRNRDGRIDLIYFYDPKGIIEKEERDDDFDDIFESRCFYLHGNTDRCELTPHKEGSYHFHDFFQNGVIETTQIIDPEKQTILRIERYHLGILQREVAPPFQTAFLNL